MPIKLIAQNGYGTGGNQGGAVTITAGNAGGTTAANGGNITLMPGTAVSTGLPGYVGVNTTTPGNTLTDNGSFGAAYNSVASSASVYTAAATDYYIIYNGTATTLNLPAALASGSGNYKGRVYIIRNAYTANVSITANGSELIDGAATFVLQPGYTVTLISTGAVAGANTTWSVANLAGAAISSGDWTQAATSTTAATKANNQYVTGNVGIGNFSATSPLYPLDITNSTNGSVTDIGVTSGSSTSGGSVNVTGIKLSDWYQTTKYTSEMTFDYQGSALNAYSPVPTVTGASHGVNFISGRSGFDNFMFRDASNNVVGGFLNTGYNALTALATTDNFVVGGSVGIGVVAPLAQLHTTGTVRFAGITSGLLGTDASGNVTAKSIAGTTNQIDLTNGNAVSGSPTVAIDPSYTANLKAMVNITGGGNVSYQNGYFLWGNRFIAICNGYGSQFSSVGYFDITFPGNGDVITGVGGLGNVTCTASGVPMSGWQALYYILPIGSANTSTAANFRIATFTGSFVVPETWILVALVNGDDNSVRVCNGTVLEPGQSMAAGTGTSGGWTVAANMVSSRDDINSSGTSSGVAAGLAMTTVIASGVDEEGTLPGVALPFTFYIGGLACTYVGFSANGFIQFNTGNSWNSEVYNNTTIPYSNFTIPTLCYYWDDMVTSNGHNNGNGIRYGTGGSAPNRIFIIDFDLVTYTGSFYVSGQIALHEGSNSINVTYSSVNAYACGQGATIGLQVSQNECIPLTYNTKTLDDNASYGAQFISFSPMK